MKFTTSVFLAHSSVAKPTIPHDVVELHVLEGKTLVRA